MPKVLITGGAGYIGSHTAKLLAASGYEPVCYDNLSTGHAEFVKWGPLVTGDLNDTEKLRDTLRRHAPVAVIHFAASAYVGESVANPFKYYRNNVGGTLSLLEAMRSAGIGTIIFSSTCAIYGTPSTPVITEDCPQDPINPYGRSKLMIERILADLAHRGELDYVALRYFNAAGADTDGEIGEWHEPETHLIPLALEAGLGGEPLNILGTDFPTPDGTAVRDYVHVEDLAHAHRLALELLLDGGTSAVFNLGTGTGSSVREVVDAAIALGVPVRWKEAPRREGDPAHLVADADLAKRKLGWSPRHVDIREVINTALLWRKKR